MHLDLDQVLNSSLRRRGIFPPFFLRGKATGWGPPRPFPLSSKEILMNTICCRVAQIAFVCAVLSLVGLEAQAQTYVFGNASFSAHGLSSASSLVIAYFI